MKQGDSRNQAGGRPFDLIAAACLVVFVLYTFTTQLSAQTFTVLHTFTGPEGNSSEAGLTMDQAGNLYGTAYGGGNMDGACQFTGCGAVFKMTRHGSSWTLMPLYKFSGPDGSNPAARVIIAPDGTLYGTTVYGGASGYGVVFRLQPPPTACKNVLCPWTETVVHSFTGGSDGAYPTYGDLLIDRAGNVYGTAIMGGSSDNYGVVFELSRSGGGWTENVLHTFQWSDGAYPYAGVILDRSGNLYGTTYEGGGFSGVIYELTPSGSGWTETVLHEFDSITGADGGLPYGALIADPAGNFYGVTSLGGQNGGGSAFELSPSGSSWTFSVLYSLTAYQGSLAKLAMDGTGNLYGTLFIGQQEVFRLTPSNGQWNLTGFTGSAGGYPYGNMILDSAGNLYGTGGNVVFEVTP